MTLRSYWFGIKVERCLDSEGRPWLWGVIWYPKSRTRLGYLYPSIRWF